MTSHEKQTCYYFHDFGHTTKINYHCVVIDNKTGERITLCDSCIILNKVRPCGLCGVRCINKTLKLDDEVFCYECIWNQVPEYLCSYFKDQVFEEWRVFGRYYEDFELDSNTIDFSSPDEIGLMHAGMLVKRTTSPNKCLMFHFLGFYATTYTELEEFLREKMLPALRQQRIDAGCGVQERRQRRIQEGIEAIAHFIPTSKHHESAKRLLSKRYLRGELMPIDFEKMCTDNDFDSFQKFLRGE